MCLEDKRLGRRTITAAYFVSTPNATASQLVGPNEKRVHLTFMQISGTGNISVGNDDPTINTGFLIGSTQYRHDFDIETHGNVVTNPFRFIGNGFASTVYVIESFLEER